MTVLVNGNPIARTVFPPKGGEKGEGDTEYTLEVRTDGGRTNLSADGEDVLWIYGVVRCNKPKPGLDAMTSGIRFVKSGPNSDWLQTDEPRMASGQKAVAVRAKPPTEDAQLQPGDPTVTVSSMIEGRMFEGPVTIKIEPADYELRIEEMA